MDNLSLLGSPIYLSGLPFGQGGGIGGLQQPGVMGPGTGGGSPFGMEGGPGLDILSLLQQLNSGGGDQGGANFAGLNTPIGQGGLGSYQLGQNLGGGTGFGTAGNMASQMPLGAQGAPQTGQVAGSQGGTSADPLSILQKILGVGTAGLRLAQASGGTGVGVPATGGRTGTAAPTVQGQEFGSLPGDPNQITADPSFNPIGGVPGVFPFPSAVDQLSPGVRGTGVEADPSFDPTGVDL